MDTESAISACLYIIINTEAKQFHFSIQELYIFYTILYMYWYRYHAVVSIHTVLRFVPAPACTNTKSDQTFQDNSPMRQNL